MGQKLDDAVATTTIGVLAGRWRGDVDSRGRLTSWDGGTLDWWIAAEDRWHDPQRELTVRQRCVAGTPVVETRLRVPGGDVVQRVYASADEGGVTVIEIENESSSSVAVVFSHGRLLTSRPPATVPIEGIDVPASAVSFPIGHHASIRVGLSHKGTVGALPGSLASPLAVARGWTRLSESASRLVLADAALGEQFVARRCSLMLNGPSDSKHDAAATLVGLGELVRMGADAVDLLAEVVSVAERLAKASRTCGLTWDADAGLAAAERTLVAADDVRAANDVGALRARLGGDGAPPPVAPPEGIMLVPWLEQRLARPMTGGRCVLLGGGHPREWRGVNWEVHQLPAGPRSWVSYAVRWHADRPAILWEVSGDPVVVHGGAGAPDWQSAQASGEVLWPQSVE